MLKFKSKNRNALTLLELLIVITILIALSGIVVATLPGLLGKTETAAATANVSEIDAAIKRQALVGNGVIGNRFDSLIGESSGTNGGIPDYVGGSTIFQSLALTEADVEALNSIGILELIPASTGIENATFDSHKNEPMTVSNGTKVCSISPEQAATVVERIWNIPPEDQQIYLVFGLGERCSLVGAGAKAIFAEAPLHFSDDPISNPKTMYSRYLIVVELKRNGTQQSTARYIGTAIPHMDGLQGIGDQFEQFFSNR